MAFRVQEVSTKQQEQQWLDVARTVYRDDPTWVCPLDGEIKGVFDPKKNTYFDGGEAARWLLLDGSGQAVGRIAAFYNNRRANKFDVPTGGVGFFECINNQEGAHMLFDTGRNWLQARGLEAMDGPVNFGENHMHWGLLVEGFTAPGLGMPYNPLYYKDLLESYGFELYFTQYSKHMDMAKSLPERFLKIADWVAQKKGVEVCHARKKELKKFGEDFRTIYNDAWRHHEHFTEITPAMMQEQIKMLDLLLVEEFLIFAYVNGDPAGFIVCLPDLNQIIKPFRGKPSIWQLLLLMWRKRNGFKWYRDRGILTRGRVIIMGVRRRYQQYGIESAMMKHGMEHIPKLGFQEMELSWVGDFNPKMRAVLEQTGGHDAKLHYTYRYYFDPAKRGQRSTIITVNSKEADLKERTGQSAKPEPTEPESAEPTAPSADV